MNASINHQLIDRCCKEASNMLRFGEIRSVPQLTLGEADKSVNVWVSDATKARLQYAYDDDIYQEIVHDEEDVATAASRALVRPIQLRPLEMFREVDVQMPSTSAAADARDALPSTSAAANLRDALVSFNASFASPGIMGPPAQASTPRKRTRDAAGHDQPPPKRVQIVDPVNAADRPVEHPAAAAAAAADAADAAADAPVPDPLDISRIETPDERFDFIQIAKTRATEAGRLFDDQSFLFRDQINKSLKSRPSLNECIYRCNGDTRPHEEPFTCTTCHRLCYRSCDEMDTKMSDRCFDCRLLGIKKPLPYRRNIAAFMNYVRNDNRDPKVTISKYLKFVQLFPTERDRIVHLQVLPNAVPAKTILNDRAYVLFYVIINTILRQTIRQTGHPDSHPVHIHSKGN